MNARDSLFADTLRHYKNVSSELTVSLNDDLILRDYRIVLPSTLDQRDLQLAHESHQGVTKTKSLLREKEWFPDIDQRVEAMITNCIACQANTPVPHVEPLKMSELPEASWHNLSVDFFTLPQQLR